MCAALTPGQAGPAAFLLQTTVRKGKVVLFGQSDDPSQAPRLLLTYTLPDAEPGEADWSQIRRDAQHSGRSRWHLYDPGGKYTPTQVAVVPLKTDGKPALSRDDLRQSPLLYGGRIFNALDAPGLNRYQLVARDRSGQVLSDVTVEGGKSPENENKKPIELPKFLVAGGRDRLYFFTENSIFGYSLASGSLWCCTGTAPGHNERNAIVDLDPDARRRRFALPGDRQVRRSRLFPRSSTEAAVAVPVSQSRGTGRRRRPEQG